MFIYLGLLRNVLRYEGRDRYQMMGVILNLSDSEAQPHHRLVRSPQEEAARHGDDAGQRRRCRLLPPPAPAPGVSCVFFIKNVRQESAAKTMDRIARGELGLCILVWVPLMLGADDPKLIRRWRKLAMGQTQLHLRANYAVLALVFAEMAGRKPLWETELGGFNMQESPIMRKWRQEAGTRASRRAWKRAWRRAR